MGPILNFAKITALKYIQMQQDLPFSCADVHSGKSLATKPASLALAASKAAYVSRNKHSLRKAYKELRLK